MIIYMKYSMKGNIIMKKLTALALAVIMALSLCGFASAEEPRTIPAVTYTGETVNAASLAVGETFYWTFSISEGSGMFSGAWLVDYPEEYLTPVAVSSTWSGGLSSMISDTWSEGTAYSDQITVNTNKSYQGATGNVPVGEPNNMYIRVLLGLNSFSYWGLQMGGPVIRVKFRVKALPPMSAAGSDNGGRFINIPIIVLDNYYYVEGSTIAPGNTYYVPYEQVNTVPGKVYMNAVNQNLHTVKFFDITGRFVDAVLAPHGGAAQAPEVPAVVNNDAGCYRFYGWDRDISNVTQDMNVFAEYLLVGDADLNGVVEATDALLTLRASMELMTLEARGLFAADINGNGYADAEDALSIMRYSMELMDTLV